MLDATFNTTCLENLDTYTSECFIPRAKESVMTYVKPSAETSTVPNVNSVKTM